MSKGNSLGNYIRNKRKEMDVPGGVSGLARRLHCSVSYLSRVERGNADGPSLKFLQEVSQVLKVEMKHLVQLKEQDSSSEGVHQGAGSSHGGEARKAPAGSTTRHAITVLTEPFRGHFQPQKRHPQEEWLEGDRIGLRADLDALAAAHVNVAEKLCGEGQAAEALDEQLKALAYFERLENWSMVAFCCLNAGRAYRQMSYDLVVAFEEQQSHLFEAQVWFERGYATFTEHVKDLSVEHLGRRTECLAQMARTDELLAVWLERTYEEPSIDFVPAEAHDALKRVLCAFYLERARIKREEALTQYEAWTTLLQSIEDDNAGGWENRQFLLGEAYHRIGIVYRDLAHCEADIRRRRKYQTECVAAFLKALQHRRTLASAFPKSREKTEKYLDRLANTHGEFGLSIQLQQDDKGVDKAAMREEAYWQFRVAETLYAALGLADNDPRVEYVSSHVIGIQIEEVPQSEIISRRRIDDLLAQSDFGSGVHPAFEYPMVYCLTTGKAAESVAEVDRT